MEPALLSAEHIRKTYDQRIVLSDISLTVHRGEAVALVGENGCGKSTLLRILCGMTRPTSGRICIAPHMRLGLIPDRYEKTGITISRFMAHMLALENLSAAEAQRYYRMFALEDMIDTPMKYLSKGTLQKVAAVQALVGQRDLLFVDEPLSGQDAASRFNFTEELRARKRAGTAIVMAVHEPSLIEALADRIYEIQNGRLKDGTEYATNRNQPRCVFLLEGDPAYIEALLRAKAPEAPALISACGRLTRLEADALISGDILRALVSGGIHIVRFEEGKTPC